MESIDPGADVALTVPCPRCDAAPGQPCQTSESMERAPHRRRTNAYLASLDPSAGPSGA